MISLFSGKKKLMLINLAFYNSRQGGMCPLEVLPVRFHFGGEFDFDGYSLNSEGKAGL